MLHAALVNFLFVVANGGMPLTDQAKTLESISSLRSKLGQKRFSRTKANLFWMEGLLHKNLGFTRHAERVLERARRSFTRLQDPYDLIMVTLDLAQVLVLDGETRKIEQLQQETIAALEDMIETPAELEEALTRWRRLPHSEETLTHFKEEIGGLNRPQCRNA